MPDLCIHIKRSANIVFMGARTCPDAKPGAFCFRCIPISWPVWSVQPVRFFIAHFAFSTFAAYTPHKVRFSGVHLFLHKGDVFFF